MECVAKGKAHIRTSLAERSRWSSSPGTIGLSGLMRCTITPLTDTPSRGAQAGIASGRLGSGIAYCDKGFKGNPKQICETVIHLANRRRSSMIPSERRWYRRRNAIEAVIGHMKENHRMDRNYLKGTDGDNMIAIMAACGFILRKLLRAFFWLLFKELGGSDGL